jgi:hypothetical protein
MIHRSEENLIRRIAVLSALVLAGGLLGPGTALATQGDGRGDPTDRWIGVEDEFTVVLPNGETLTGDETPMEGEDEIPPVGTRLFVSQALYETEDGATRDDQLGRAHIQCTAQVVPVNFLCDVAFVFDTGSPLHGTAVVDFSSTRPTPEPLQFDLAVTGGTADFFGATGEISVLDISDLEDPQAQTLTLYEVGVVLPHDG